MQTITIQYCTEEYCDNQALPTKRVCYAHWMEHLSSGDNDYERGHDDE